MKKYTRPVTPSEVNSAIASLCAEIVPGIAPFHIEVRPQHGEVADDCFDIVGRRVSAEGGNRVVGWSIWELPTVFVEAEFHSIWQSPSGAYVDLTPKREPCSRILFLPDLDRAYEGCSIDNIRRPIISEPLLIEWFEALGARFDLMNRGERAFQHGEINLVDREAVEYTRIEDSILELGLQVERLYPQVGPYLPCVCGCGKKAKWCLSAK